jgi:CDP-glucose 4,6-dehydratase
VVESSEAFWKDKRVLVTGHTGFKGSWLCIWLQKLGAEVVGYALAPHTEPSLFEVARVSEGMTSIVGDVRDAERLQAVMAEHRPDVVFHLAAQALVRRSYLDPLETLSTNVMGTANMLEAVRQINHGSRPRAIVSITSDKCYRNKEWSWGYRETDELGGHDPYSGSKGCAELVIRSYRDSFFPQARIDEHQVAVGSTRAGNVIGGGDWATDRLIPDIIRAIVAGKPVIIRSPYAIRPWQHVLEPLNGYLSLAEHLWTHMAEFASAWNFGPSSEDAKTVSWIVDYVTKAWGEGARWELDAGPHPHEDTYLKLDCSKASSRLGWRPKLDLATTLDWIVEWYRTYQEDAEQMHPMDSRSGGPVESVGPMPAGRMRALTEEQIARFEAL